MKSDIYEIAAIAIGWCIAALVVSLPIALVVGVVILTARFALSL